MKKICILIPCYNEEKGIGKVLDQIPQQKLSKLGYETDVIVINNNSKDKTAQIAKGKKATVVNEKVQGKGFAIRKGFSSLSADTDYVVMIDGDNTYKVAEIPRLIELLESNFCDAVVGSRLGGKTTKNSLKFQNRIANWGYTFLVRHFYRANVTDVLSGYFAWKKDVITSLLPHLNSGGFAIEMEMITKMVKLGFEIYSVPITYDQREGKTKLSSLSDGIRILYMFFRNIFWKVNEANIKGYEEKLKVNYK